MGSPKKKFEIFQSVTKKLGILVSFRNFSISHQKKVQNFSISHQKIRYFGEFSKFFYQSPKKKFEIFLSVTKKKVRNFSISHQKIRYFGEFSKFFYQSPKN